jgi:hypothetical protein
MVSLHVKLGDVQWELTICTSSERQTQREGERRERRERWIFIKT